MPPHTERIAPAADQGPPSRAALPLRPLPLPLMSRRNFRLELAYTLLFSSALAVIDGAVIGVVVRTGFEGVVPDRPLNFVVAVLATVEAFSNIASFFWAAAAHGRDKVRFINALQVATLATIALIGVAPKSPWGLYLLTGAVVVARVFFSGVLTLRSTVWHVNYPRRQRARATGIFATAFVLVLAIVGFTIGRAMKADDRSLHFIVPAACALGVCGVAAYSRIRVRGHKHLLRTERQTHKHETPTLNPASMWRVLASDHRYAFFQLWLFLLGTGNLMIAGIVVVLVRERFHQGYFGGIIATSTIPLLTMVASIPFWAHLLGRVHIIPFRAIHSWTYVVGQSFIMAAAWTGNIWPLYIGSVFQGLGLAGGQVAWNLGHLDFAPPHKATSYMGVHVTLNGIRGIISPFLAMSLYEWLESHRQGSGAWVVGLSVLLCLAGAIGYVSMALQMRSATR